MSCILVRKTDHPLHRFYLSAARSVLQTIASVRKNPSLRHGFISGNRDVLDNAVGEVRTAFRPKKKRGRKAKSPQEPSKKRKTYFKHVIACLPSPRYSLNPSRQEWDHLYDVGLGRMWRGHAAASIPLALQPKDFHALLLSMYPALMSTHYELCKLGGAYNNELTTLEENDRDESPISFSPYWTPETLRHVIGNKAQLIIRPLTAISSHVKKPHPTVSW